MPGPGQPHHTAHTQSKAKGALQIVMRLEARMYEHRAALHYEYAKVLSLDTELWV